MSSSARPSLTAFWMYFFGECDQIWQAVVLYQQKNGFFPLPTRPSQSSVTSVTSESIVCIRLRVNGPVSLILCLPTRPNIGSVVGSSLSVAQACSTPRGPYFFRYAGFF